MPTPHVKPTQVMLGLPAERLAQLRALADHRGVTAVAVVEDMIRRAIEDKEIGDDLPGLCEVKPIWNDSVGVTIRGRPLPPMDRLQVRAFAALLSAAAGREVLPDRDFKVGTAISITLDDDRRLYVGRNASAVLLGLVDGKTNETTFRTATTASLATDFAALLRKHAAGMAPPLTKTLSDGSVTAADLLLRILNTETTMPTIPTDKAKQ
ncbi:hypothetical protein PMNALOAF_3166 [Methylobacterium adhaesivum]|uniref:Ribbon-helix-helix protein CopG domain-containing protein n=1 Tax=Methylobacterium adhaesivum TaxID=333297 RepID=A0ABT8BM64_9HYPH|nr:hypothetical protein [Methylobacterium adhaesivum]MDN3592386.1 hypothetical protein [Methylobacterium adhaesivum]GJD31902.1 hypothetical protein PMNALOAF_3166 [Methylobacterium adhaesivum]